MWSVNVFVEEEEDELVTLSCRYDVVDKPVRCGIKIHCRRCEDRIHLDATGVNVDALKIGLAKDVQAPSRDAKPFRS